MSHKITINISDEYMRMFIEEAMNQIKLEYEDYEDLSQEKKDRMVKEILYIIEGEIADNILEDMSNYFVDYVPTFKSVLR